MTQTSPSSALAPLSSDLVVAIDHVGIAVPDLDVAIVEPNMANAKHQKFQKN